MSSQYIAPGSGLAVKVYSAALFNRMARKPTFRSRNTGPAPKEGAAAAKLKRTTTSPGMPIVEIRDLAKGAGDRAQYDIVDILQGKPIMGDRRISGRMMKMDFSTEEIVINQYRGGVDPGGRMTKKRTIYDLRKLAMANLDGWNNNMMDNIALVHLAGARGFQTGRDWSSVPVESDPDFADILVNEVVPPSYNRRFLAEDGSTSGAQIDSGDVLTLDVIDSVRTGIDESEYPMQGIQIESGDYNSSEDDGPLYVMYVSPRGYSQIRDTNTDKDWNSLVSAAVTRANMSKHPIFGNGALYWRGIVIKQTNRVIRFPTGSAMREFASDGTTINTVTTAVGVDRAIVLGAQAMVCAFGSDEASGYHLNWNEEVTDHKARVEISTSIIGGWKKLRFKIDGVYTDHGVVTVDHYNGIA